MRYSGDQCDYQFKDENRMGIYRKHFHEANIIIVMYYDSYLLKLKFDFERQWKGTSRTDVGRAEKEIIS